MSQQPHSTYKSQSITLKFGAVFGFSSTQPLDLACQQGCVWVTQNGVDLVLNAGEKIRLSAKDHIVVEALQGNACIGWVGVEVDLARSINTEEMVCSA